MTAPLVSIITPAYNSELYIEEAIASVRAQTYDNWEMVVVDDCSTDGTRDIVQRAAREDPRIHLLVQEEQAGAGPARTRALDNSAGRFIAYLDSDDRWHPEKLERQVDFMLTNGYGFSCASYEVINDAGASLEKRIRMMKRVDYVGYLTNNLLQTVGIMADTAIVDKALLRMPPIPRRQDAATWLQVLRAGHTNYGLSEVLGQYRRTEDSLSSNKYRAVIGIWKLYRDIEKLPLPFASYCFVRYACLAVWKRTYINKYFGRVIGD